MHVSLHLKGMHLCMSLCACPRMCTIDFLHVSGPLCMYQASVFINNEKKLACERIEQRQAISVKNTNLLKA